MSLSKLTEKTRYHNKRSFSQPFRPTVYPSSIRSRIRDSGSTSSSVKRPAKRSTFSSNLAEHEIVVNGIIDEISKLQIFALEPLASDLPPPAAPTPEEPPGARLVNSATLLNGFRKAVANGTFAPKTWKLPRVPRASDGLISGPLGTESRKVSASDISRDIFVLAERVSSASPYESFEDYIFASEPTVEQEKEFYANLVARIKRARAGSDASSSLKGCGNENSDGVGAAVRPAGPVGPAVEDLTPERLLVTRRQNSEEFGW